MIYYLITFANTHSAMVTHSHLERDAAVFIMPTLREISASCGISIRFSPESLKAVLNSLTTLNLTDHLFQLYKITDDDGIISADQLSTQEISW